MPAHRLSRRGRPGEPAAVALCPRSTRADRHGFTQSRLLCEAGVNVCLGTDSAATCDTYNFFEEMRFLALYARVASPRGEQLQPFWVVRAATLNGARALGLESSIGSLEAGKLADLVAVDAGGLHCVGFDDPYELLVYAARADDVRLTMVKRTGLVARRRFQRRSGRRSQGAAVGVIGNLRRAGEGLRSVPGRDEMPCVDIKVSRKSIAEGFAERDGT